MNYIADPDRFRADCWKSEGHDNQVTCYYVMDTHNAGQECTVPFLTMQEAITRQDRLNRLHALTNEYPGPWVMRGMVTETASLVAMAVHQFAAIRRDGYAATYTITTHETMPDALAQLADSVLDGDRVLGVIDLDTGASHGVHIATPVVSDIGGEGATAVPWDDVDIPALDPGRITSRQGSAW